MGPSDNLPAQRKESASTPASDVPAALIRVFLENQAKMALSASAEDREKDRAFRLRGRRASFVFAGTMAVLFVALLVGALMMNKDQVALEIIKAVIFIATGGAGGYAMGKQRSGGTAAGTAAEQPK